MASNVSIIDDCFKVLAKLVPINESSEEAKALDKIMSKLRENIDDIKRRLELLGMSIEKLQTEVNHVIFRHFAKLTKR